MEKIKITCDSTCDLTEALYREYDITVAPLGITLVSELYPFEEILETIAGCKISSHCGPNCLGVLFFKK